MLIWIFSTPKMLTNSWYQTIANRFSPISLRLDSVLYLLDWDSVMYILDWDSVLYLLDRAKMILHNKYIPCAGIKKNNYTQFKD